MGVERDGNTGSASCDPLRSVSEVLLPEMRQLGGIMISSAVCAPVSALPVFDARGYLRQKHHVLKMSRCVPNTRKYATPTV
jgi:hypothetical protein